MDQVLFVWFLMVAMKSIIMRPEGVNQNLVFRGDVSLHIGIAHCVLYQYTQCLAVQRNAAK